jgi:hypothetical protein
MNKYKIPNNFFDEMEIDEVLDFPEIPILYTLRNNKSNRIYLSYLDKFNDVDLEQRFVVQINSKELDDLKHSRIKIEDVFHNSKENIFILYLNQLNGKVESSYKLSCDDFENIFCKVNAGYISYDETDCPAMNQADYSTIDDVYNKIKKFISEKMLENPYPSILYSSESNFSRIKLNSLERVKNYA